MNIVVITHNGKIVTRPDTTWEKDSEDFFPPEFIDELSYTPILFARVCKPGRSVSERFADRYFDGINYGILLYPEQMIDGSETGFSTASMVDHTSFLPAPLYNKVTLGIEDNEYVIYAKKKDEEEKEIFRYNAGNAEMIKKAIKEATSLIYIRTGDMIAIELAPRQPLCKREDGDIAIRATYCENPLTDFNIKM